jgi:pyruvate formate lyase activating enzyme
MEATIVDIQRMSTEDGPGLRTTVFLKGCNLACAWCHNPETIGFKPDVNWYKNKCIGCGICQAVCKQQGISRDEVGVRFKRELCIACRTCEIECPNGAIELKGKKYEIDALFTELIKDKAYWGADGGVTLSGGEVMMQPEAATLLAKRLKAAGVNVALDTAGCYKFSLLEGILPFIDLVLYDLKVFDPSAHREHVGADNEVILENYRRLMATGARVWVRTPVIEGATDGEDNIASIGRFLTEAGMPEKWELCAFNNLCRDKYERLDLVWMYKDAGKIKREKMESLATVAQKWANCAMWSGMVD